jgi:hypothetical protein
LARYHAGRASPEAPAEGESQSNGKVEEIEKTVRDYARAIKAHIEDKGKVHLQLGGVLVQRLVGWRAMLASRFCVGRDSRRTYERRRGHQCRVPTVHFGELVLYKEVRETKGRKNKVDSEWKEGIWLGHARNSDHVIIGTTDGVGRAYAVKRMSDDARWSQPLFTEMKGDATMPRTDETTAPYPHKDKFRHPSRSCADSSYADEGGETCQEDEA